MATNIWQDPSKTITRNDPRVVRVDFDKQDLGARKSHISGIAPKNENTIRHIKGT